LQLCEANTLTRFAAGEGFFPFVRRHLCCQNTSQITTGGCSDFDPGPGSFTRAYPGVAAIGTQVDSAYRGYARVGVKNNDTGDAITGNFTRGGTPQCPFGGTQRDVSETATRRRK
jgi:hypothetical protein